MWRMSVPSGSPDVVEEIDDWVRTYGSGICQENWVLEVWIDINLTLIKTSCFFPRDVSAVGYYPETAQVYPADIEKKSYSNLND